MARNPYFSGPIASSNVSAMGQTYRPFQDTLHEAVNGGSAGGLFGSLFYNRKNDPDAQLADYRRAQADAERQKVDAVNRGQVAGQTFGSTLGELTERVGGPQQVGANASKMLPVVLGHLNTAVANGMDPKAALEQGKIWAASTGDAGAITAIQSAFEGKYLGENESATIGRQDVIREDKQAFEADENNAERRLKKYGFDLESGDRRYNTDVDASTQRRGQDVSAGTARRGQDIGSRDQRRGQDMTDSRERATAGYTETKTVTKDKGAKETKASAFGRLFGKTDTPGRPASTTTTTTRRPGATTKMVYDPATGGLKAK